MNVGKVVQVIGPTVDVAFDPDKLPRNLNAIKIEDPERGIKVTAEAALHMGDNVVRCIAMSSTEGLVRGMKAVDTGEPITVPVGEQCLGRLFNLLGETIDGKAPVETAWAWVRGSPSIRTIGSAAVRLNSRIFRKIVLSAVIRTSSAAVIPIRSLGHSFFL